MTTKEGDILNPHELTDMFRFIVDNMATRDELMATRTDIDRLGQKIDDVRVELRRDIRATEQRLLDHTTRECGKVRGDVIVL